MVAVRHHADGRLIEAETICRAILRRAPRFADPMILLAVLLCLTGQHDKRLQAIVLLRRAVAIAPRNAQGLEILGDALTAEADLDAAIDIYQRAIAIDRTRATLYSKLGIALNDSGRNAEAIVAYGAAIIRDPAAPRPWFNLGVALTDAKREAEAIEVYREAIKRQPHDANAYLNIGNLFRAARDYTKAIEAFRGALQADGRLLMARFQLAATLSDAGAHDEALTVIDAAIAVASDLPETHLMRGNILLALNRPAEAEAAFLTELARVPKCVPAHNNLGVALQGLGRLQEAVVKHRDALALDPDYIQAHTNLGVALHAQGDLIAARAAFERAIALPSDNPQSRAKALSNLALLQEHEGDYLGALDLHRQAIAVAPDFATVHFNFAINLLRVGDLAAGWDEYEWRWKCGLPTLKMPDIPRPMWDGSELNGRTLLVHAEQGVGDTLQFVRYLPPLARAQGSVTMVAPGPLRRLLRSLPDVKMVGSSEDLPPFDVHLPLMSLPRVLGTKLGTIPAEVPYLAVDAAVDQAVVAGWRRRIGDDGTLKVGVVWSGNPKHVQDRLRSIAAAQFLPQLAMPGIKLFSLQKEMRAGDRTVLAGMADTVTDLAPELSDFCDTGAALSALDLVISVDTSVAHLAGALARPVWTLLPFSPDWRWLLEREDSVWYPTMRLFRQTRRDDWDDVLIRVRAELSLLALRRVAALRARNHLDIDTAEQAAFFMR
jgi:tetratricopeptide (TPR) repeat protein